MIRYKVASDNNFIHSTWCTNLHSKPKPHTEELLLPTTFIPWNIFCLNQNQIIDELETISNTLIYCIAEDPDVILGYLCYSHLKDNLIIHFGFVKDKFRNNHIMSELLKAADEDYKSKLITLTHVSKMYGSLGKKFSLIYDPYIISKLQTLYKETQ
jgi:hypothetical protein